MNTWICRLLAFLILLTTPAVADENPFERRGGRGASRAAITKKKQSRRSVKPKQRRKKRKVTRRKSSRTGSKRSIAARKKTTGKKRAVRRTTVRKSSSRKVAAGKRRTQATAVRRTTPKRQPTLAAAKPAAPPAAPVPTPRPRTRTGESWRGALKRTIARSLNGTPAPVETFTSLDAFIETLPPDEEIRVRNGIYDGPRVYGPPQRFTEERRRVRVSCWLHAVRHDTTGSRDERDIQLILGSSESPGSALFLIAEIPAGDDPIDEIDFGIPRRQLAELLANEPIPSAVRAMSPRRITVEGSLFFDGLRRREPVDEAGPSWIPATVWEIHPVTSITMEPAVN